MGAKFMVLGDGKFFADLGEMEDVGEGTNNTFKISDFK
jgi:hypothetical protein